MVEITKWCSVILVLTGSPLLAETVMERLFPDKSGCYARSYSAEHLAAHPAQRVTRISVIPEAEVASPQLGLWVRLTLRATAEPGAAGDFEALAYCSNAGPKSLECGMEGDAGSFLITPARKGAILIKVGKYDMSLENDAGFATLSRKGGDDASFLLPPATCR
jgi:hypothetical protein